MGVRTAPGNLAAHLPGDVEITPLSDGPPRIGAIWRGRTAILGRILEWTGEFTRVDIYKDAGFQTIEAAFGFRAHLSLEGTAAGVCMTFLFESRGFGGDFGTMADLAALRIYQRRLNESFARIPEMIEKWAVER
ncbi:SRPBCC family protein [Gordonia aurantiaca]|uniref:hypothetical protein n=1 Tax=Gordonia sp. B21 TaxID=3151852 RepID=UPI0032655115